MEKQDESELEEMSKGENKVKWIKGQRIGWLGHLERMEDRIGCPKRFSPKNWKRQDEGEDPGKWKEEVEKDLQVLGMRRWRELVINREKWKDIVQHAKAHSWLYCQWKKKKQYQHLWSPAGLLSWIA